MAKTICSVDWCDRPVKARGWCAMHYQRWVQGIPPDKPFGVRRPKADSCAVIGCPHVPHARGLCSNHYRNWRNSGSPIGRRNAPFAEVGYNGAHARVIRLRGRASGSTCTCGKPAEDWAYTHNDPDERSQVVKGWLVPYSMDPAYYVALCRTCHWALDHPTTVHT